MLLQPIKKIVKQYASILAVRSGLISLRRAGNGRRIVLFMYHRVTPERDVLGLSVSPLFFDQQLEFLKSRYKLIGLAEAVSMLMGTGTIDSDYAVLTFDDGYRDNYDHAFQLLKKHNVPATIFVTVEGLETGYFGWHTFDQAILRSEREVLDLSEFDLGSVSIRTRANKKQAIYRLHHELKQCSNEKREAVVRKVIEDLAVNCMNNRVMLTWHEAREMQSSGLVTFGSHTMSHPILTRVDHARALNEIAMSKAIIEEKLESPVELFAYPNGSKGSYDDYIVGMLKNAGFSAACTTIPGSVVGGRDLFQLPRIDVTFSLCEGIGGRFSPEMFEVALCRLCQDNY